MANVGSLNTPIYIFKTDMVKDAEGFTTRVDRIVASVRAYLETRNATAKWEKIISNAAFAGTTAIFKLRKIPKVTIDNTMFILCEGFRYNILNVENVKKRGMYIEVLAAKVEGSVS